MTRLAWLAWTGWIFAAFWLLLASRVVGLRRRAPTLPEAPEGIPGTTVLLPVRNEEENLVACVSGLARQAGKPKLLVVDDASTDATPRLLDELAAQFELARISASPLRAGWTGKVNALASGLASVSTPWVLLTDADTRHAPDLLARAHAAVAEHGLDALSLAGLEEARGPGENLLTPPVFALLDALLGDWSPHARGEGEPVVANGQYFLIRTAALRAIGGFEALLDEPLDDVALARALRSGGFRVGFRRAGDRLRVRMYSGFAATVRGWRRNLALIFGGGARFAATVCGLAVTALATFLSLALAREFAALIAAWAGGAIASARLRASSGNPASGGLWFPLDVAALAGVLLIARRDARRGRLAAWRGRPVGPGSSTR